MLSAFGDNHEACRSQCFLPRVSSPTLTKPRTGTTMRALVLPVCLLLPSFAAWSASDLSIATAASGNSSGACAVTGDGRSRVVLRCTGQPEFEAQVTDAIGTLLPSSAIHLDEEVSTPGYAGSTQRSTDLTLSQIVFTPKPSSVLERAGQLEKELNQLRPLAKKAGTLEQQNKDLQQQLEAARSLKLAESVASASPGPVLPATAVVQPPTRGTSDEKIQELLAAVTTQGKELAVQAEELRRLRVEQEAKQPRFVVPTPAPQVLQPALQTRHTASAPSPGGTGIHPASEPEPRFVGVATRTSANPLSTPVGPPKWYARLHVKDAQAEGARYIPNKDGQLVLVMGPFDTAAEIADLARMAIYPVGIITSLDLQPIN